MSVVTGDVKGTGANFGTSMAAFGSNLAKVGSSNFNRWPDIDTRRNSDARQINTIDMLPSCFTAQRDRLSGRDACE
jgi:hypothetical protein